MVSNIVLIFTLTWSSISEPGSFIIYRLDVVFPNRVRPYRNSIISWGNWYFLSSFLYELCSRCWNSAGFPGKSKTKDTTECFGKNAWWICPEFAMRCSGNMAEEGPEDAENPRDDEVAVRQADVGYWDVATVLFTAGQLDRGHDFHAHNELLPRTSWPQQHPWDLKIWSWRCKGTTRGEVTCTTTSSSLAWEYRGHQKMLWKIWRPSSCTGT